MLNVQTAVKNVLQRYITACRNLRIHVCIGRSAHPMP